MKCRKCDFKLKEGLSPRQEMRTLRESLILAKLSTCIKCIEIIKKRMEVINEKVL
jgi:hypothetical protein